MQTRNPSAFNFKPGPIINGKIKFLSLATIVKNRQNGLKETLRQRTELSPDTLSASLLGDAVRFDKQSFFSTASKWSSLSSMKTYELDGVV
jgi:hypothetical protein